MYNVYGHACNRITVATEDRKVIAHIQGHDLFVREGYKVILDAELEETEDDVYAIGGSASMWESYEGN